MKLNRRRGGSRSSGPGGSRAPTASRNDQAPIPAPAATAANPRAEVTGGLEVCETRRGAFHYFPFDGVIGQSLKIYGEWAEAEIEFLRQFVPPGSTVIDAGANIGTLTAAFSEFVGPAGRVIAIEASPEISDVLRLNVGGAAFGNVTVVAAALGGAPGEAQLPQIPSSAWSNVGGMRMGLSTPLAGVRTPVITLNSVETDAAALLKLDLEGAEVEVLAAASSTLDRMKPVVACEMNELDAGIEVIRLLRALGYRAYFASFASYNPNNFNGAPNGFGFAREASLIFIPPGHPIPWQTTGTNLQSFVTTADLARLLAEMPRYGDATAYDRIADRLVEERKYRDEQIAQLVAENHQLRTTVAASLQRQRDAILRIITGKDARLHATMAALEAAEARISTLAERIADLTLDRSSLG